MKKFTAALLALTVFLSLSACGKKEEPQQTETLPVLTEAEETEIVTQAAEPELTQAPTWGGDPVPMPTEAPAVVEVPETEPHFELDAKFKEVDETVYATRDVNIRTKPTVNSNSPGKLMKGESVQRIGISQDGWSAVVRNQELLYIASQYLSTQAPQQGGNGGGKVTETPAGGVMYTVGDVNLRKGPGADTPAMTMIPKGSAVNQLAICSNGWIKVEFSGTVGYVAGNFLSTKAPAVPSVPETTAPETTVPSTSEPAASEPVVSEPNASEPAATEPSVSEPAATQPAASEPAATQPAATEPAVTKPSVTEPAATESGTKE